MSILLKYIIDHFTGRSGSLLYRLGRKRKTIIYSEDEGRQAKSGGDGKYTVPLEKKVGDLVKSPVRENPDYHNPVAYE